MKTLILTSLLLAGQTGPAWNVEERAVPSPIPSNICVEAHITDKGRKAGGGYEITFHTPPHNKNELHFLKEGRNRGLLILKRCSAIDS